MEEREIGGRGFVREDDGGITRLSTVGDDGEPRSWEWKHAPDAFLEISQLFSAEAPPTPEDLQWLLAAFPGFELAGENVHEAKDLVAPRGGSRTVISFGRHPDARDIKIARRSDEGLSRSAELWTITYRVPGEARMFRNEATVDAPAPIAELAEHFGEDAARALWGLRPGSLRWPGPPRLNNTGAVFMSGGGYGGVSYAARTLGPFRFLQMSQRYGSYTVTTAEATVVDGEAVPYRFFKTYYDRPSSVESIDADHLRFALETLIRSVDPDLVTLEVLKPLARHIYLGEIITTQSEVNRLCAQRVVPQFGRGGGVARARAPRRRDPLRLAPRDRQRRRGERPPGSVQRRHRPEGPHRRGRARLRRAAAAGDVRGLAQPAQQDPRVVLEGGLEVVAEGLELGLLHHDLDVGRRVRARVGAHAEADGELEEALAVRDVQRGHRRVDGVDDAEGERHEAALEAAHGLSAHVLLQDGREAGDEGEQAIALRGVVDEGVDEGVGVIPTGERREGGLDGADPIPEVVHEQLEEDGLARLEVAVDVGLGDLRLAGDGAERGPVDPLLGVEARGRAEDVPASLLDLLRVSGALPSHSVPLST
jgi:hypothetical protein